MQLKLLAAAAAVALAAGVCAVGAAPMIPSNIGDAVANPNRPQADRDRDAARKPAEVLAFAGVKPGESVTKKILDKANDPALMKKLAGGEMKLGKLRCTPRTWPASATPSWAAMRDPQSPPWAP